MAKLFVNPTPQANLTLLTGAVLVVVVVGGLYWAQTVLVPVALAVFLAFPLAPLVTALERYHLGRKLSVVVVVVCTTLVLSGVGWLVHVQIGNLADKLPAYSQNVQAKVAYLGQLGQGEGMKRLETLSDDITGAWKTSVADPNAEATAPSAAPAPDVPEQPAIAAPPPESPVPEADTSPKIPAWLSRLPSFFGSVMVSIMGLVLAVVLVVFMLLEREALRNRLIRLVGSGRMTETTRALDDAGHRISRYLLMQLAVNGSYGLVWSLGLYIIGVDYALLWGFLAAILRYLPYIGAPLAALLPITLSLAQFPGWWQPIAVIALFLTLELVSNNVVEPWLYGQSIGVSAVAMVVAAAFWTFLWGPIGLVLAGPLTVCLVVLGKHVPELQFFAVLLGDAPALEADMSYYQRLMARDQDEAAQLVMTQVKASDPEQVYDTLLVPALVYTQRDRERGLLTEADEEFVLKATHEVLEDLGERQAAVVAAAANEPTLAVTLPAPRGVRILACPARDDADRLALEMLRQLLNPAQWDVEVTPLDTLTSELVAHVTEERSTVICIGSLPPGGLTHTRHLCKRLRARHPELKIIVGRWGLKDNVEANRAQLLAVGADRMATTLLETRKQLNDWLPALAYEDTKTATADRK
jgi:predicted PurR-regulated permease PerM/methylmalonyl-CoA mutase cobalamin-binding subunit